MVPDHEQDQDLHDGHSRARRRRWIRVLQIAALVHAASAVAYAAATWVGVLIGSH